MVANFRDSALISNLADRETVPLPKDDQSMSMLVDAGLIGGNSGATGASWGKEKQLKNT